jgi:hypothetical protein
LRILEVNRLQENTRIKLTELGNKLGAAFAQLEAEYNYFLAETTRLYPTTAPQWKEDRARHLVYAKYAKDTQGSAVALDYIFFNIGDVVDFSERPTESALAQYKENPQKAINAGLVADGNTYPLGTVLDTNEFFPGGAGKKNPNYKKPLQPFKQRRCVGFCAKFGTSSVKLFIATLRDTAAVTPPTKNTPLTSRFNVRTEDQNVVTATSGKKTTFDKPSINQVFVGWTDKKTTDLLASAPIKTPLEKLDEVVEQKGAIVLVEADIINKNPDPSAKGNYNIRIGTLEEDNGLTYTVFMEGKLYKVIEDMDVGTKLLLLATLSKGNDLLTGTKTAVLLNALDIWVTMAVTAEQLNTTNVQYKP